VPKISSGFRKSALVTPPLRVTSALLYGHYRIAYLVKDDGNIDILGVFHGALDIARYQL
jgi:plasmid stabilization system protein ParE